jgi:thymidylate synthase (FAD)
VRVIEPCVCVPAGLDGAAVLRNIEAAGRVCYRSEDRIGEGTAEAFVASLACRGHESVLEHAGATVVFVCDRGVSHELVRHRLASYSQESTRYVNYGSGRFGGEIEVVRPFFFALGTPAYGHWRAACTEAECRYLALLEAGTAPQEARSVLPMSLATRLVMTADLREWRHVLRLRCASAAHPQMRQVMIPLLLWFKEKLPAVFADVPYDATFPREYYAEVREAAVP